MGLGVGYLVELLYTLYLFSSRYNVFINTELCVMASCLILHFDHCPCVGYCLYVILLCILAWLMSRQGSAITLEVPIVSVFVCHPFVLIDLNYLYENYAILKCAFH